MNASRIRRFVIAVAVGGGLALAGCATSPATRFYVLTPVSLDAIEPAPVADGSTIGVRSVELPDELDRPQIVTRTGPNTVHFAKFDRWSASLRDSARQLIAANLATLLPGDQVAVYPWTPGTSVDRQVIVEITRFDGELGGRCVLRARWRVLGRRGTPASLYGESALSEPSGPDYAALVAAQSRLLGALSLEIARAIQGTAPSAATAPAHAGNPHPGSGADALKPKEPRRWVDHDVGRRAPPAGQVERLNRERR